MNDYDVLMADYLQQRAQLDAARAEVARLQGVLSERRDEIADARADVARLREALDDIVLMPDHDDLEEAKIIARVALAAKEA